MTAVAASTDPTFQWNGEFFAFRELRLAKDPTILGPAVVYALISPANTTAFAKGPTRGLFVGAAGIIYGQDAFGNQVNGLPVIAGWNPVSFAGIDSTSTTATNIWGVW